MSKDNKENTEKELASNLQLKEVAKEVVNIVLNEILDKYDKKTNNKDSK